MEHVLGDGNCTWRAAHKAARAAGVQVESNWKTLKKRSLRMIQSKLASPQHRAALSEMMTYGAWSMSSTHICLAEYLRCSIQVHTEDACWTFQACDQKQPDATIHLALRDHHCAPAKLLSYTDDETVINPPHVAQGDYPILLAGMERHKRKRTKLIHLYHNALRWDFHIPHDWSRDEVQNELSRCMGLRSDWVTWTWQSNNSLSYRHSDRRPNFDEGTLAHILEIIQQIPS
eukprot:87866-Amphidinium_carterae.1